ncbi:protease [Cohnella kolymensis]|uniref:Protease n=1 Tax=Cohnella kolymensis TaxID=1590652 RepID=A0ABR5A8C4_9BACL|nr:U32 family peptidase [Cohnella kolymensis]KIL37220.1 protease [Cohnella kolymensis]
MVSTALQDKPRTTGKRQRLAKPELLAPAGSLEKLKFAVHYGADAVYIGGQKYGLRSNADNFSIEEMRQGVEFAAKYGAKVFVATNIYAHQEDLAGVADYLRELEDAGISAIIAADPAIVEIAQKAAPKLEVHLSTQQSTMNWQAVQFWKEEGLPRVVLAREATMDEIREMKARVDIELEVFIHGAMCSSVSGRCVLSNHFTDRDSNRGGCCQSCRWKYNLHADETSIAEVDQNLFTMSSKDLCMIQHIPDLIDAGVDSFKIEGRMKSIHYVASVVNAYRQAIDSYMADPEGYVLRPEWVAEIGKAANRPLNTGFFYSVPGAEEHIYEAEEKPAPYDFAAVVTDYDAAEGIATVQQRSPFRPGMEVEFIGPDGRQFAQQVGEITDEDGNALSVARHPLQKIRLKTAQPVMPLDLMRKRLQ